MEKKPEEMTLDEWNEYIRIMTPDGPKNMEITDKQRAMWEYMRSNKGEHYKPRFNTAPMRYMEMLKIVSEHIKEKGNQEEYKQKQIEI